MAAAILSSSVNREHFYQTLISGNRTHPNREWLARIIASWLTEGCVLPDCLGLEPAQFKSMRESFFPGVDIPERAPSGVELDYSRMLEKEDLIKLLRHFRKDSSEETDWMIGLIVAACLGSDHLWQDLGLWNRSELSALLAYNFPALAERNQKDMKWKKFLYKQLCEAEGLYLCRAPSCEVCADYSNCFGPEQ